MTIILAQNWMNDDPCEAKRITDSYMYRIEDIVSNFNGEYINNRLDNDDTMISYFVDIQSEINDVISDNNDDPIQDNYLILDIPIYVSIDHGRCKIVNIEPQNYSWETITMIRSIVESFYTATENANPDFKVFRDANDMIYVCLLNVIPRNVPMTYIFLPPKIL